MNLLCYFGKGLPLQQFFPYCYFYLGVGGDVGLKFQFRNDSIIYITSRNDVSSVTGLAA